MCILSCEAGVKSLLLKPMTQMHAITGEEAKDISESGPDHTLDVAVQFGRPPFPPILGT